MPTTAAERLAASMYSWYASRGCEQHRSGSHRDVFLRRLAHRDQRASKGTVGCAGGNDSGLANSNGRRDARHGIDRDDVRVFRRPGVGIVELSLAAAGAEGNASAEMFTNRDGRVDRNWTNPQLIGAIDTEAARAAGRCRDEKADG